MARGEYYIQQEREYYQMRGEEQQSAYAESYIYGYETVSFANIGQSNRFKLSLWALVSTFIIDMCKKKGHAMIITTSIAKKETSLIVFVFVDDADLLLVQMMRTQQVKNLSPSFNY